MPSCVLRIAWVVFKPRSHSSSSSTFLACSSLVDLSRKNSIWSMAVVKRCLASAISYSLEMARWMRVFQEALASCRSCSFRARWVGEEVYECVVPVLIVIVHLSTLFNALPWFEWGWEPGGVCGVLGIGTVEMAERCSGENGKQWGMATCGQSRKKEVILSRRTCQESLACIWFCMFFLSARHPKRIYRKKQTGCGGNVKVRLPRGHRWFMI